MTEVTREMLLAPERGLTKDRLEAAEMLARGLLLPVGISGSIVWAFKDAPDLLREICTWNGGDEDWLVVRQAPFEYVPRWIDMEPDYDVYALDDVTIYVTSHG